MGFKFEVPVREVDDEEKILWLRNKRENSRRSIHELTCRPWWEQCLWRRSWSPDWWSRQGCCSSWEEVHQILMLLLTFNQTVMMGDLRQQDKILSSFFWPSLQSSSERTLKLAKIVPVKSFEFNYLACLDVQFQLSSEEKWDQFQLRFEEDWNIMLG